MSNVVLRGKKFKYKNRLCLLKHHIIMAPITRQGKRLELFHGIITPIETSDEDLKENEEFEEHLVKIMNYEEPKDITFLHKKSGKVIETLEEFEKTLWDDMSIEWRAHIYVPIPTHLPTREENVAEFFRLEKIYNKFQHAKWNRTINEGSTRIGYPSRVGKCLETSQICRHENIGQDIKRFMAMGACTCNGDPEEAPLYRSEESGACPKLDDFSFEAVDDCEVCSNIGAHMRAHNGGGKHTVEQQMEAAYHLENCVIPPMYRFFTDWAEYDDIVVRVDKGTVDCKCTLSKFC